PAIYTLSLHDALPIWDYVTLQRAQELDHRRLGFFDHCGAFVQHQDVERNPVADVARRRWSAAHRYRRINHAPAILEEQLRRVVRSEEHTSELQSQSNL